MTFTSLLLALACSCYCLEASRAFPVGPAAYTTITNRIDIMGAVESAQENNAGGYRGQNIYSEHEEHVIMSNSKIPDVDVDPTSPDAFHPPKTSSQINFYRFPSTSGVQNIVAATGPSFSYITTSSGPSISISSAGPDVRLISYSTPGRIFVSHGSPGSSYVISSHRQPQTQIQAQKSVSSSSSSGENLGDRSGASESNTFGKTTVPEMSASSSSSYPPFGLGNDRATPIIGIPDSKLSIPSIIDLVNLGPSVATGILHGSGHPAYVAAYGNLQAARQVVHGISAAVTRAVNINLTGIARAQL